MNLLMKVLYANSAKLFVASACLVAPQLAQATLISIGDSTLDTRTGLEWLDVTKTSGMSIDDVLSGPLIADGWSLATLAEFGDLASSYVGTNAFVPTSDPVSLLRGGRALALLGCTLSVNSELCQYNTMDPLDPITFAVLGILDDGNGTLTSAGFGSIMIRVFDDSATITWDLFSDFYSVNRREPQVGSFLVRYVSVTEPGTLALFGIGLLGMVFSRRGLKTDKPA